ncbi:MAG: RdgB/HAM1 family non-canonical purine NTP pyrophosphatase [Aquiluna sp.]|nr:RdgB/HAM1 family non-canonical purine NTP pyrophosphatase [Aquiluna sp.]
MELVFATGNAHKVAEAQLILGKALPDLLILAHDGSDPLESGVSFLENAQIKARAAFQATGKPAFADDSGICVEVMGGAPGIFSAIWAGGRDDIENRDLLLKQLEDIPAENRMASFVCTIALVEASGETSFTGVWPGRISMGAAGNGGFGYDPVFVPEGFEVTAAELDSDVKSSFSHRSMAMRQMASFLTSR